MTLCQLHYDKYLIEAIMAIFMYTILCLKKESNVLKVRLKYQKGH